MFCSLPGKTKPIVVRDAKQNSFTDKFLKFESKNTDFDSALAFQTFKYLDHLVLFDEANIMPTLNGIRPYVKY